MTAAPTVGLVSMPWMAAGMPSIQLATLKHDLLLHGIPSRSHELYLDYAALVGLTLYEHLSDAGGFIEEYLFARLYFRDEAGADLASFRRHRPPFGFEHAMEERILDALEEATEHFLHEVSVRPDFDEHDILGFSLTISQTAPSMALARLLKRRHPGLSIVFGGSACAGPMGRAVMQVCPYVDAVVLGEGEDTFPEVVHRLRNGRAVAELPGVVGRASDSTPCDTGRPAPLHRRSRAPQLDYDDYFARLSRVGLAERLQPWMPIETSRGCWWGQKHQCTFCGLHEIMSYRTWHWRSSLEEMERLEQRYGVTRFFAVDLIMPNDAPRALLPEISARGHDWTIFYEVKANLRRADVERMADAGVRWIQPGIESLSARVLALMDKGVSPIQNLLLLKWCREFGIEVTWNIISGFPGEDPTDYMQMALLCPSLHHLQPPRHVASLQLHRFSPYFEAPEAYGVHPLGAHPLYRHIFPVQSDLLDDLVYLHDFKVERESEPAAYTAPLREALAEWQAAWQRGARLEITVAGDAGIILDTRNQSEHRHTLTRAETDLYLWLDGARGERGLVNAFAEAFPASADALERCEGINACLARWDEAALVVRQGELIIALAPRAHDNTARRRMSPFGAAGALPV